MKYKTLFRIVVKLIGVYLVAMAVVSVATNLVSIAVVYGRQAATFNWRALVWIPFAGSAIKAALGLYLFFGGRWIVNLAIPGNRPYCPECGYDLTGSPGGCCPECGTPVRPDDLFSTRTARESQARSESNE